MRITATGEQWHTGLPVIGELLEEMARISPASNTLKKAISVVTLTISYVRLFSLNEYPQSWFVFSPISLQTRCSQILAHLSDAADRWWTALWQMRDAAYHLHLTVLPHMWHRHAPLLAAIMYARYGLTYRVCTMQHAEHLNGVTREVLEAHTFGHGASSATDGVTLTTLLARACLV